jgi:hypothetical protein
MRLLQWSGGEPLYSMAALLGRSRRLPEATRRVPSTAATRFLRLNRFSHSQ